MNQPVRYEVVATFEYTSESVAREVNESLTTNPRCRHAHMTPVYELKHNGDTWVCGKCGTSGELQMVEDVVHWWNQCDDQPDPKAINFHGGFDYGDGGSDSHIECCACYARNDVPTDTDVNYV